MLVGERISSNRLSRRIFAGVFGRSCGLHLIVSVPLGLADLKGRAFGMHVVVRAHEERRMFGIMSAWAVFLHVWMPSCF